MSILTRLSDVSNFSIGTFYTAPSLLVATGINPTDKAIEALLQGLVGIVLMFLTRAVARLFEKKKVIAVPVPVVPLETSKPLTLTKNSGNEESSKKEDNPQSGNIEKEKSDETENR